MDKKNRQTTINLLNKKDNKCFRYVVTVALDHEEIGKHPERIAKIKLFLNKYNWEGTNYPSGKDDWKTFTIALNLLYSKEKNICPAFVSKH